MNSSISGLVSCYIVSQAVTSGQAGVWLGAMLLSALWLWSEEAAAGGGGGWREVRKERNEEQGEVMDGAARGCGGNDGQLANSLFVSISL